jgi:PAS domain-containing protein
MSERLFRATLEAMPVPAYVFDSDPPGFIMANTLFCELIGYPEEELLRIDWRTPLPFGSPPPELIEWRFRHRDGRPLQIHTKTRFMDFLRDDKSMTVAFFVAVVKTAHEKEAPSPTYFG